LSERCGEGSRKDEVAICDGRSGVDDEVWRVKGEIEDVVAKEDVWWGSFVALAARDGSKPY
jgi:hypothetical protein